jgi:UDP-N-acetylmuramoyl-tripeptide--D-alanyl-D-alanine ligase
MLFKVATPGRHFAVNGLGALAAVWALGADRGRAMVSLSQWSAVSGRGARETVALDPIERNQTVELIDDAYNANPVSVAAALAVLASAGVKDGVGRIARGRRIAILGDMKELGPQGAQLHAGLADLPAMAQIDQVHCVGPLMRALHAALPEGRQGHWAETSAEMAQDLRRRLDSGDVVLVKGSLSMGMAGIVDAIRKMGHPASNSDED